MKKLLYILLSIVFLSCSENEPEPDYSYEFSFIVQCSSCTYSYSYNGTDSGELSGSGIEYLIFGNLEDINNVSVNVQVGTGDASLTSQIWRVGEIRERIDWFKETRSSGEVINYSY